ncbi:hypothetical protein KI387_043850 [Taxus chinensis]|uniref:F-box domain-containing protein n=1 Tax=Taxus chinensis TaxID=29808 RepID=A0AA38FHP1_TAXCH|nr:hypothetical protein KI387_043850 [Taxus chinensis]
MCYTGRTEEKKGRVMESIMLLPEEIIHEILSWLPLHKLFQVQSVCHLWRNIVFSSHHFHKLWEERNKEERWVVRNSNQKHENKNTDLWFSLFNRKAGRWLYKKTFSTWNSPSWWFLGDAAGGLLLYINKKNGRLLVVNPLTMRSRMLPDPFFPAETHWGRRQLSFFLKGEQHSDVNTNIVVNSTTWTYQVFVSGNSFPDCEFPLQILVYTSVKLSWQIKNHGLNEWAVIGNWLPYKCLSGDQTFFCCPMQERFFDGDWRPGMEFGEIAGAEAAGICGVVVKGGNIVQATLTTPLSRCICITYEFDKDSYRWNAISVFRCSSDFVEFGELLCEKEFVGSFGGDEDCIWMKSAYSDMIWSEKDELYHEQLASTVTEEIKLCPQGKRENTTAFAMAMRFSPCP